MIEIKDNSGFRLIELGENKSENICTVIDGIQESLAGIDLRLVTEITNGDHHEMTFSYEENKMKVMLKVIYRMEFPSQNIITVVAHYGKLPASKKDDFVKLIKHFNDTQCKDQISLIPSTGDIEFKTETSFYKWFHTGEFRLKVFFLCLNIDQYYIASQIITYTSFKVEDVIGWFESP